MTRSMRTRATYWLQVGQYDWMDWHDDFLYKRLPDKVSDWIVDQQKDWIEDPVAKIICKFWGHLPTMDHCGMPKHDHCMGCGTAMPGLADRSHLKSS